MRGALRNLACLGLLLLGAACASPRYVGSIGRNDVYSNRGFGVLVDLSKGGVLSRWTAIDPSDMDAVPVAQRPRRVREPLDLDGDGLLQVTEATVYYDPSLRLVSKTSSVAKMDLEVQILGENNETVPIDGLLGLELKRRAGTSSTAQAAAFASIERRRLTGDVDARVAEVRTRIDGAPRTVRLLLADVPDFLAEEGQTRRHIVRLELTAAELDAQMREDFDTVVAGMLLAPKGARTTTQEKW